MATNNRANGFLSVLLSTSIQNDSGPKWPQSIDYFLRLRTYATKRETETETETDRQRQTDRQRLRTRAQ